MLSQVRAHPRLASLALALVTAFSVLAVNAGRSRTSSCQVAPPVPQLPAQLRSLGDFDQPLDASDPRVLQDVAVRAAAALHGDLGGQSLLVGDPVDIGAGPGATHDAIVIPLGTNVAAGGGPPRTVEALVVFLRDCSGHAYFSAVEDLAAAPPPGFPVVSRAQAAARLGAADPAALTLVYTDSPFRPQWRDPHSGAAIDAQPPGPSLIPTPLPQITVPAP
ncbi:MAG TPA: hypothetical protein VI316_03075 [Candidatus Dormibacteraeota bacterium]